jgi:hypothetical protein
MERGGLQDCARRPAEACIAVCERVRARNAEVRDEVDEVECRDSEPGREQADADNGPLARQPVPETEAPDDERDPLVRGGGQYRRDPEESPALLVQPPERVEQQRQGEAHRMEAEVRVERIPLRGWVGEVCEHEACCRALGAEVLSREPEHGQCPGADRRRLDDEQDYGARPDQPERREEHEQRIHVPAEPENCSPFSAVDSSSRPCAVFQIA